MSDPLSNPHRPPATPPPPLAISQLPNTTDPPPPYPSPNRRRTTRPRSSRRQARLVQSQSQSQSQSHHPTQGHSTDSDYESLSQPHFPHHHHNLPYAQSFPSFPVSDTEINVGENTPLLLAPPSPASLISSVRRGAAGPPGRGRPRSLSHTSAVSYGSAASSLAQTVISLFQEGSDEEGDGGAGADGETTDVEYDVLSDIDRLGHCDQDHDLGQRRQYSLFSRRGWQRYFRPMTRRVYYMALFHLLVLNFPYALAAWVYLFVFTLTGTTLMIALPLGTVLCFFDLLGARAFSRGELALQSTFHSPLAYAAPYPPRPIFTRLRAPTASEIEAGLDSTTYETSFYKNAYSMFTDSTSYQALFYFLVIKPSITLIFSISLVILFPVSFVLVLPAPAFLRAMRKLGIWQANVAIEGLYLAVS